jgi:hypothetical protein
MWRRPIFQVRSDQASASSWEVAKLGIAFDKERQSGSKGSANHRSVGDREKARFAIWRDTVDTSSSSSTSSTVLLLAVRPLH